MNPQDLLYAATHEWVAVSTDASGRKIATVGLSKFALDALTDLVFIDLLDVGAEVVAGERFGEIESVKTVSDLYAPVSGRIVEANKAIADRLDDLSADPYDQGWLVKLLVTDESALGELLNYAQYQKQLSEADHG